MTRKALAMIKSMADAEKEDDDEDEDKEVAEGEEDKDDDDEEESKYVKFWKSFGKYIKMGLIEDAANRTRLAKLLRYSTSKSGDKEISLEEYVANMKEDQKNIYYISASNSVRCCTVYSSTESVMKMISMSLASSFSTDGDLSSDSLSCPRCSRCSSGPPSCWPRSPPG